ncbi:porin [Neptunomonas sp.]|uniref:porin n=1 Tax=Neptunomonas sp. TaxID=1971898 RepID=UPI0025FF77E1|nr:porin [Neptunomonas sp.]
MKNKKPHLKLLTCAIAVGLCSQASAGLTLYDKDDTTFSADGLINTFYVNSHIDDADDTLDRSQSRVKMGFLPNYIGFNFGKQIDDLKLGARSSFWVTINDGNSNLTDTMIDVRQFYGTVDGEWGQVLIGKDFSLFGRSNILGDELLLGYGQVGSDGLVDSGNVSFGNIGTGYLYPFPNAQITYRTPRSNGFQLAVGIMDPAKSSSGSEESTPRLEAELTFETSLSDNVPLKAWVSGMAQSSNSGAADVDSNGVAYGVNVKVSGLSLSASGFSATGVGTAGLANLVTADNADVDGYLVQAAYTMGSERLVASYGENSGGTTESANDLDAQNTAIAWFHTVNSNLKLVAEYDRTESDTRETDTVALGAVLTW